MTAQAVDKERSPSCSLDFCQLGITVIDTELQAIELLKSRINDNFHKACQAILKTQGHIIVLGMGKSGHIAKKLAATLASTGTPAFFIHPSEASHGDMGMITADDLIVAISYSGETHEMLELLPFIKRLGVSLIVFSGQSNSTLAKMASVYLDVSVSKEACPLGLAPTASTTVCLVLSDALAIALLQARGFTQNDFARFHPGGTLGRRLLTQVSDIMHSGEDIPIVTINCSLDQALVEMTRKSLGITLIVNDLNELVGVFTHRDLRRSLDQRHNLHQTLIIDVMTKHSVTILLQTLAIDALQIMRDHKITALPVIDQQKHPLGVVHMHSLLRAGVI